MNDQKFCFPMTSLSCLPKDTISLNKTQRENKVSLYMKENEIEKINTFKKRTNIADMCLRKRLIQEQTNSQINSMRQISMTSQLLSKQKQLTFQMLEQEKIQKSFEIPSLCNQELFVAGNKKLEIYNKSEQKASQRDTTLKINLEESEGNHGPRSVSLRVFNKSKSHKLLKGQISPLSKLKELLPQVTPLCPKLQLNTQTSLYGNCLIDDDLLYSHNLYNNTKNNNFTTTPLSKISRKQENIYQFGESKSPITHEKAGNSVPLKKENFKILNFPLYWNEKYTLKQQKEQSTANYILSLKERTKQLHYVRDKEVVNVSQYREIKKQELRDRYSQNKPQTPIKIEIDKKKVDPTDESYKFFYGNLIPSSPDLQLFNNIIKIKRTKKQKQLPEFQGFQDTLDKQEMEDYFHYYVLSQRI